VGRTYLLARRISDLVVVEGVVWLTAAQFGLLNFTMMSGDWWAAHGLKVAGIGMVAIPVGLDLRHAVASRPLVGDLRAGWRRSRSRSASVWASLRARPSPVSAKRPRAASR
jgi:hypothetical protein